VQSLVVEDISVAYDGVPALRRVSLTLGRGMILGLIGPPGSGKTTLLKVLAGLVELQHGSLHLDGERIDQLAQAERARWQQRVGMAFQNNALFDRLSVFDNVAFPLRRRGLDEETVAGAALLRLEQVGLIEARAKLPSELSGGMQKRLAIARATVHDPEIGLFDEPIAGLDPASAAQILDLIASLAARTAMAAVIATHDLKELLPICNRVVMLFEGRLAYEGTPAEIARSRQPEVAQFVTGSDEGPL